MITQTLELPLEFTHSDPDAALLQRVARGDDEALCSLYAAYGQRCYAYALRLTEDPATAEEVLQESLVALWRQAKSFRGEGRVIAWMLGIVHHKALDHLRRKPTLSLDDDTLPEPADRAPLPEHQAQAEDQRLRLRMGMNQLPMEQRMVLELVFYQGLSLEETAKVIGCPSGTVKSRLNHAKTTLRGILARSGMEMEDLR